MSMSMIPKVTATDIIQSGITRNVRLAAMIAEQVNAGKGTNYMPPMLVSATQSGYVYKSPTGTTYTTTKPIDSSYRTGAIEKVSEDLRQDIITVRAGGMPHKTLIGLNPQPFLRDLPPPSAPTMPPSTNTGNKSPVTNMPTAPDNTYQSGGGVGSQFTPYQSPATDISTYQAATNPYAHVMEAKKESMINKEITQTQQTQTNTAVAIGGSGAAVGLLILFMALSSKRSKNK